MPTYNSNLGRWLPDHNPRTPHWAAPLDCGCLGCRIFGMGGDGKPLNTSKDGAVIGLDGKPLAPLAVLAQIEKAEQTGRGGQARPAGASVLLLK